MLRLPGLLRTLRGRLAGAMVLVFLLALAASATLDALEPARQPQADALRSEPYQDGLVLAAFSLAALVLIWLVSSWSLRPLARASREAQAAGPGNAAARLSRSGLPAEIAPLVDAVNGALDRMADAVEAERRFTENAAHELRTPLAVLGLRLQRARAHETAALDWPALERDLAQMNRLVNQMLDLARKQHARRATAPGEHKPVNLSRLGREAAAMILPLAEAQGRDVLVEMGDDLIVSGVPDDLRDALRNLLENAVIHGAGTIGLSGELHVGAGAVLLVTDEGGGVEEARQEAAFARFGKASQSEGSGLGLAIVREVARAHGGDVVFVPGPGCRIRMTLPG